MTEKRKRGFALWDRKKHLETSSKGGKGAPPELRPFAMDPDLAERAGREGGYAKAANNKPKGKAKKK